LTEKTDDAMAEVGAMQKIAAAVAPLDPEATARVIRWAADRYGVTLYGSGLRTKHQGREESGGAESGDIPAFGALAELHSAASPESDADKALVAGYWFQFVQGQADFASQAINAALKDLGHGVGNITSAFDTLKAQKPALVMQLKKAGTTKQARKTYKLTAAGKKAVELMIGQS
jgi:hypothetical protein